MKTREEIITSMCYTYRHDYGLLKEEDPGGYTFPGIAGMTRDQQRALWNEMARSLITTLPLIWNSRMNNGVKELEKLATTVVEGWSDENGTTRYYEFNREKFAELIIKETLQIARVGMEFGLSMDEAVYTYFGINDE